MKYKNRYSGKGLVTTHAIFDHFFKQNPMEDPSYAWEYSLSCDDFPCPIPSSLPTVDQGLGFFSLCDK